jgi:hypothetical protein
MEVTLKMNKQQAKIVDIALELFTRLHLGQLEELLWLPIAKNGDKNVNSLGSMKSIEAQEIIQTLKKEMFGFDRSMNWGLSSDKVADQAKIACDIHEVIRYKTSWHNNPNPKNPGLSVSFDEPFHWHRPVPLCEVEIKE